MKTKEDIAHNLHRIVVVNQQSGIVPFVFWSIFHGFTTATATAATSTTPAAVAAITVPSFELSEPLLPVEFVEFEIDEGVAVVDAPGGSVVPFVTGAAVDLGNPLGGNVGGLVGLGTGELFGFVQMHLKIGKVHGCGTRERASAR
jgi:hypothetical protein